MKNLQRAIIKYRLSVMYLPILILFLLFVFIPMFNGIHISTTNWNGYSQQYSSVGIDNFVQLGSDSRVARAFVNTLFYGVISTLVQNVWGLAYALLLNRMFVGRNVVRAVVYVPVIMSGLVMGYIWYFILQYAGGALNDVMHGFGLQPVDWLADGNRSVGFITFITSMQFVGQAMIIYLAGLQLISPSYYEAAAIDGAGKGRQFASITLPLLMPAIITTVILKLIGGLQTFDHVMALTGGGPGFSTHSFSTLIQYLYSVNQNAGLAAALGIVLFVMILIITVLAYRVLDRKETHH